MQQISLFNLTPKKEVVRTSKRAEIVKEFVQAINTERINTKFKQITPRAVAIKLSHMNEDDLYYFLSVCKDYKNRNGSFAKAFFGMLKVRT